MKTIYHSEMNQFFQFEADFVDSLRCIPMQVRLKLDTCGIKLKLPQWHQFTASERQQLVELSCSTPEEIQAYRELLQDLVKQHTGETATDLPIEANPEWMNPEIPTIVQQQAAEKELIITSQQWKSLSPLQRFVLIKLSKSSHENKNFLPAIKEFQLV